MSCKPFNTEEYFMGQADACMMFAKQFIKYLEAAKNDDARDFCMGTIKWLKETEKNFRLESLRFNAKDIHDE